MKTITDYLDDLKEKTGSDYKAAKAIGIGSPAMSTIRSRGRMGDETAIKVAEALGIDESEVLIAAAIARSDGKVRTAWERISKNSGITIALIILIQFVSPALSGVEFTKCILC